MVAEKIKHDAYKCAKRPCGSLKALDAVFWVFAGFKLCPFHSATQKLQGRQLGLDFGVVLGDSGTRGCDPGGATAESALPVVK